jgi:hypothetical protein
VRPAKQPVLFFCSGELVDIQQDIPFRVRPAEFLKRRASPQSARIIRILPEIVEKTAAARDIRDIVRPVVNRRQRVAIPGKSGVAELLQRQPALLGESDSPFALDLFQPQIRIVVGCCDVGLSSMDMIRTPWALSSTPETA